MTLAETAKLLTILAAAYPNWRAAADESTLALWHEMLADLPDMQVILAAKRLIATSPYPPTIAELRKNAVEALAEGQGRRTGDEAWEIVLRAIRNHGPYRYEEAKETIPEDVQAIVKRFSWRELNGMENDQMSIIRSQFIKMFDAAESRRLKYGQIPAQVHDMSVALAERMAMDAPRGEGPMGIEAAP